MKQILVIFLLIVSIGNARSAIVISCDGIYSAKNDGRGQVVIARNGGNIDSEKIDHTVNGGAFSLDDSVLVVFGMPDKVDARYPQVTHLSIYHINKKFRLLKKEVYGGGVYDVTFSVDRKFIVVNNQFGVDLINLEGKKTQSFDMMYVPPFKTQKCEKGN